MDDNSAPHGLLERILCAIGLHSWRYAAGHRHPGHGDQAPVLIFSERECIRCSKRQAGQFNRGM